MKLGSTHLFRAFVVLALGGIAVSQIHCGASKQAMLISPGPSSTSTCPPVAAAGASGTTGSGGAAGSHAGAAGTATVAALTAPPPVNCDGGLSICKEVANEPYCYDPLSITCQIVIPPSYSCVYRLKKDPTSCPCLENDVMTCTQTGGAPGIRVCQHPTGTTATVWSACGPLT